MKVKKRGVGNGKRAAVSRGPSRAGQQKHRLRTAAVVKSRKVTLKKEVRKGRLTAATTSKKTATSVSSRRSTRNAPQSSDAASVPASRARPTRSQPSEAAASNAPVQPRPPASSTPIQSDGEIVLDKAIINKYCQRIDVIRHGARKTDKNEVFYGRCTARHNLFEGDDEDDRDEEGRAHTRTAGCMQKNRSGRSVQATSKVYMAHVLLNVHNDNPLSPCKLPRNASFRLHRLVRPACKTDKKRLYKLKQRIAREKSGLPTPSEVSSVADGTETRESFETPEDIKCCAKPNLTRLPAKKSTIQDQAAN